MPNVTPVAARLHHMIEERYVEIDRDKLTRFLMARSSQKDLEIFDCRGKRIGAGIGCEFTGQLREIFWSFIRPCIDDTVQKCCDELEKAFDDYTPEQRAHTVEYLTASLQGFANRMYGRMIDLDRRMRGKGFPDSVQPYDPSREVAEAHAIIEYKLGVIARHYGFVDKPTHPKLTDAWDGNLRLPFVTLDTAKGLAWLKSTKAWAIMKRRYDSLSAIIRRRGT